MKRWMMLVALVVLLAGPGVMHAAPLHQSSTLDQDNENDNGDQTAEGTFRQAQTFTAGRSGVLDRIDVRVIQGSQGDQVDVQITSVTQDAPPTSTVLGSGSFDSRDLPTGYAGDWASVSINPAVQVVSGVQYAIVLSQGVSHSFLWRSSRGNQYSRGNVYDYDYDGNVYTDDDRDYFFRTYVLSPPPPSTPTCFGKDATIFVKDGKIVGGPDNGKAYTNKLRGTKGNDVMVGTDGKDMLEGSDGNDLMCGLGGDDTLNGNNGDDKLDGGTGKDKVDAGVGNDQLIGGDGDDTLQGNDGNDTLNGGAGKDRLEGGNNNDTLTGGADADTFKGGPGTDTATDYNASEGDTRDSIP